MSGNPARARPGRRRRVCALAVAIVLVTATALGLSRLRMDTTVGSFLPATDSTVRSMREAERAFGGDPIVIVAESDKPRALLGEDQLPRLLRLEADLARTPDVAVVYGPGTVLNQVAGAAQDLLATITGTRDALRAQSEAAARASGASPAGVADAVRRSTAQFDERYAALLVQGLPAGLPTLRNPGFVNAVAFDRAGNPRPEWQYVIPAPNAVAILIRPRENLDQAGTQRVVSAARGAVDRAGLRTSRVTVSGSPSVAAELGTTVERETPLIGGLAVLLIALCYLFVPWTPRRSHRLLPLAATLSSTMLTLAAFGWLGRPLSLGVITFLPIVIGIGSDFPAYLINGGVGTRRIVVVAVASSLGFAALALSPLPFVRDLGLALALGVLLAVAVALGLRALVISAPPEPDTGSAARRPQPWTRRGVVLVAAVLVALVGWALVPRLTIEARPDKLAAGLPSVADAQHTEDLLGSSGEVEVLLHGDDVRTPQALAWLRAAEDAVVLKEGSRLHPIVSLPDLLRFLGPSPTPEQLHAALGLLPHYLTAAVLSDDGKQSVLSLGLSLQDLAQQGQLLAELRAVLPAPPPGMSVDVVGLPVAASRGVELVSQDRYLTNLAGIAAAALALLVGLRRWAVAGRAMFAAMLATGWELAGVWLLGVSLSPLSVALGSLTTATACEFTALLGYAGSERKADHLRRTVGVAALAASVGYLALVASQLVVIRNFGLLLATTVVLSLLAARLVVRTLPWPRATSAGAVPEEVASRRPNPTSVTK